MSWLDRWRKPRPAVAPELAETLDRWRRLAPPDRAASLSATRFLVVDTETTGPDPMAAALLSIGACRVASGALSLDSTFEVAVRPPAPSADDNILVHGIGRQRQLEGLAAAEALTAFLDYAGRPVFVGFHARFDATVLQRALRRELGVGFDDDWLDLAIVLPALFPGVLPAHSELDRWLGHFGIVNFARHSALADAWATAELLLLALARAGSRGVPAVRGLYDLQRAELKRHVMAQSGAPTG